MLLSISRMVAVCLITGACGLLGPGVAGAEKIAVDVLLQGGMIVDGSGQPGYLGDVAILGDRVVGVGEIDAETVGRTIDCTGLLIVPGFIDLHSHSDWVATDPLLRASTNYLMQGCTTQVTGNCGSGPVDLAKFLGDLDTLGTGTNIAHLIPQGAVRSQVIGSVERRATPEEIEAMRELVREGMLEGAWGMSTGLIYVPSVYADTSEIASLAEVVAEQGGIYASHIRGEGRELLKAISEAIEVGTRAGVPVHISHLKSSGEENWGNLRVALDLIEKTRENGVKITADQYPYTASSTSLEATLVPTWARSGGAKELLKRLDDETDGPKLAQAIEESLSTKRHGAALFLARYAPQPTWVGRNVAEIAEELKRTPLDVSLEILRNGGAAIVNFSMDEEDVRLAMQRPWVATASDGRSYLPGADKPHPRSYGTFPRKIGHYALREKVLGLEQAIRSATGLPAEILQLPERGLLRTGYFADVVVINPETLRDTATFQNPHQYAQGVIHVFVNGQPVVQEGLPTGALAGRALRHVSPQATAPDVATPPEAK